MSHSSPDDNGDEKSIGIITSFECSFSTLKSSSMTKHVKTVHPEKDIINYNGNLPQHMLKHDVKCEEEQSDQKQAHTDKDEIFRSFDCNFCNFKCSLEDDIVKHMKMMKHTGKLAVSDSFSSIRNVESAVIISCLLCGLQSEEKSEMSIHVI